MQLGTRVVVAVMLVAAALMVLPASAGALPVWTQQAEFTGYCCDGGDSPYAVEVAVSGTEAIVSGESGAFFVYQNSGGTWTQQFALQVPTEYGFTGAMAVSGTTALIDGTDLSDQLAVYVFSDTGGSWTQQATLTPPAGGTLGGSVALSGTTALVDGTEPGGQLVVYVFSETAGKWSTQAELTPPPGGALGFNGPIALSGTTAAVAGSEPGGLATVFVFRDTGGSWTRQAELTAADETGADLFGWTVAVSGTTVVVGSPGHDNWEGEAYVFGESGGTWTQQSTLDASDGQPTYSTGRGTFADYFGQSVAVSGTTAVVASPGYGQS